MGTETPIRKLDTFGSSAGNERDPQSSLILAGETWIAEVKATSQVLSQLNGTQPLPCPGLGGGSCLC